MDNIRKGRGLHEGGIHKEPTAVTGVGGEMSKEPVVGLRQESAF